MPCDMMSLDTLREQGRREEEIKELQAQIELRKAEAALATIRAGYDYGSGTYERAQRAAEKKAREEIHDRWHNRDRDLLLQMNAGHTEPIPVHHGHAAVDLDPLKKLGFG